MVSVATPIGMHDASGRMSEAESASAEAYSFDAEPEPDDEHQRFDPVCCYVFARRK